MTNDNIIRHDKPDLMLSAVSHQIEQVDTVLDIGCGIVPMSYFRPSLHIMLEPYKEYVDILLFRHADDKSILVINGTAQEVLPCFTDNSIDSLFLLDVIEHFEKDIGFFLLRHAERIARRQVVVFTPLGFIPQYAEQDEPDGWGLAGTAYQEHLSGWDPEDFGFGWKIHICETFHKVDFSQRILDKPHGAIFALKTFTDKPIAKPGKLVDIRRPLPSELELARVEKELARTQAELAEARRVLSHPVIRAQCKAWKLIKFWK